MSNFMFSINVTIPIFLVILLGYILKKINFITEEFVRVANKYVFIVALPVMLFQDIKNTNVSGQMNVKFFFFCLVTTIIMFFFVWGIARLFVRDKSMVGAFAQASARGSAAVLGVAFVENICGNIGMTPLMIVAAVPFFNILSVVILVFNSNEERQYSKIKGACINIIKNPIIIGIILGVIASMLPIKIPVLFERTLSYVSRTATPIALIVIGAGFEVKEVMSRLMPSLFASFIKLIGLPVIFLPIAYMMGFRDSEMVAILIMLASPTTVSCYIMAKNMGNDEALTSNVIVLTTLLSSVTLTMWIYVLKVAGCI